MESKEPIILRVNPAALGLITFSAQMDEDYNRRHLKRMEMIKQIEQEDRDDLNETADRISKERFGCTAMEYATGRKNGD